MLGLRCWHVTSWTCELFEFVRRSAACSFVSVYRVNDMFNILGPWSCVLDMAFYSFHRFRVTSNLWWPVNEGGGWCGSLINPPLLLFPVQNVTMTLNRSLWWTHSVSRWVYAQRLGCLTERFRELLTWSASAEPFRARALIGCFRSPDPTPKHYIIFPRTQSAASKNCGLQLRPNFVNIFVTGCLYDGLSVLETRSRTFPSSLLDRCSIFCYFRANKLFKPTRTF